MKIIILILIVIGGNLFAQDIIEPPKLQDYTDTTIFD